MTRSPGDVPSPPAHFPELQHLAPGALCYLNVRDGVSSALLGLALAVALVFVPDPGVRIQLWMILGGLVILSLLVELPWLNRVTVRTTSYAVTEDYVYLARGLLWRRTSTIPTKRVLNVQIAQGPLLRAFGLVCVQLMSVVDLDKVGPLTPAAAERLRDTVLAGAGRSSV